MRSINRTYFITSHFRFVLFCLIIEFSMLALTPFQVFAYIYRGHDEPCNEALMRSMSERERRFWNALGPFVPPSLNVDVPESAQDFFNDFHRYTHDPVQWVHHAIQTMLRDAPQRAQLWLSGEDPLWLALEPPEESNHQIHSFGLRWNSSGELELILHDGGTSYSLILKKRHLNLDTATQAFIESQGQTHALELHQPRDHALPHALNSKPKIFVSDALTARSLMNHFTTYQNDSGEPLFDPAIVDPAQWIMTYLQNFGSVRFLRDSPRGDLLAYALIYFKRSNRTPFQSALITFNARTQEVLHSRVFHERMSPVDASKEISPSRTLALRSSQIQGSRYEKLHLIDLSDISSDTQREIELQEPFMRPSMAVSYEGDQIAILESNSSTRQIALYQFQTKRVLDLNNTDFLASYIRTNLAFSSARNHLLVFNDNGLSVYDTNRPDNEWTQPLFGMSAPDGNRFSKVHFEGHGSLLVVDSIDASNRRQQVQIFNTTNWNLVKSFEIASTSDWWRSISSDGRWFDSIRQDSTGRSIFNRQSIVPTNSNSSENRTYEIPEPFTHVDTNFRMGAWRTLSSQRYQTLTLEGDTLSAESISEENVSSSLERVALRSDSTEPEGPSLQISRRSLQSNTSSIQPSRHTIPLWPKLTIKSLRSRSSERPMFTSIDAPSSNVKATLEHATLRDVLHINQINQNLDAPQNFRRRSIDLDTNASVIEMMFSATPDPTRSNAPSHVFLNFGEKIMAYNLSGRLSSTTYFPTHPTDSFSSMAVHQATSPTGPWLSAGTHEGEILVWARNSSSPLAQWSTLAPDQQKPSPVTHLEFRPHQSDQIVSTSQGDHQIHLWTWSSENPAHKIQDFMGHTGEINSISFSSDGQYLLSASTDGTVRLWNVFTGQNITTLSGHEGGASGAQFLPSQTQLDRELTIVTSSTLGPGRIWSITLSETSQREPRSQLIRIIGPALTGKTRALPNSTDGPFYITEPDGSVNGFNDVELPSFLTVVDGVVPRP